MGKVIRDISSKHLNPFKEEPEEKVIQELSLIHI